MIKCELVLASKNEKTGDIFYTFKQTFPRIILAEVNTHMIAAKNAASSRAIPTLKQLKNILKDPFIPISIGQYQSGMQAGTEISGPRRWLNEQLWSFSRYFMVFIAWLCYKLGAPKQFSNRLVEPWMWVEQIWSSTDVANELLLRNHWMAEPHYQELAKQKAELIGRIKDHFAGTYKAPELEDRLQILKPGQWHLPYVSYEEDLASVSNEIELDAIRWTHRGLSIWDEKAKYYSLLPGITSVESLLKAVSAGRCAWVSYYMPGDNSKKMSNVLVAIQTYLKLAGSNPKHLSPLMHVATPLPLSVRVGSHRGWLMFRKELSGESGGDEVVISITPKQAKLLLADEARGANCDMLITNLVSGITEDLRSQNKESIVA